MSLLAMFVLIALALLVWWLLTQKLRAKPWLAPSAENHGSLDESFGATFDATQHSAKLIGLGLFIAVVTALFGLFAAAYHMRMAVPDWTHLPLPKILWTNTLLLAAGSAALQWAWSASARGGPLRAIRQGLTAGVALTLLFLISQCLAWRQLNANGFYFSCTPASAFFYLLSGLHGLHVCGGLLVLSKTTLAVYRMDNFPGTGDAENIALATQHETPLLSIKLCALYWHYLLLLWLALYALLAFT